MKPSWPKSIIQRQPLILQTLFTFTFFVVMELTTWLPLRFWRAWGGGGFIDTAQVLYYGECYGQIGNRIFNSDEGGCSNYLYGSSLVMFLDYVNLAEKHSYSVGFSLALSLSFILSKIFPIKNFSEGVYYTLFIGSPPILLLAERGNFDTLMFTLVLIGAYLYSKNHILVSFFVIVVSVLIKFYTAPLLVFFLSRRQKFYTTLIIWPISFFTISVIWRDINLIGNFPSGTGAKFGFNLWSKHLEEESRFAGNQAQSLAINTIVFIITFLVFFFSTKLKLIDEINIRNWLKIPLRNSTKIKFIAVVLITCFFAGLSFDYRLIFFVALHFLIIKEVSERLVKRLHLFSLSILWLTFPSGGLAPIGDFLLELFVVSVLWFATLRLCLRAKHLGLLEKDCDTPGKYR
jgi:hypothetical protein